MFSIGDKSVTGTANNTWFVANIHNEKKFQLNTSENNVTFSQTNLF